MLAPRERKLQEGMKVRLFTQYDDRVPEFYTSYRCNTDSIKEALEAEVPYWHYCNAVFIDAPPGKGKTSFVYEVLIPMAVQMGKNIVICANRVALSIQMKQDVMELTDSPLQGRLTDKGIRDTDIFENVAVVSYHRLNNFLENTANEAWLKNVMFVVADECHYFTADSSFNAFTGYHLRLISKYFARAVRIFMTATSWDVLQPLADAEKGISYLAERISGRLPNRTIYRYWWPQDYTHVDLRFFENLEGIKGMITQSSEKTLVFVDSRERGREFADELGNRAIYLDADSKGSKAMTQLLKNQTFDKQVLVTTKVLDCGINIWDDKLRNVVVMTDDRTSLIQMLGRKRRKFGERVNLYVCDMSPKLITKRYRDAQELLAAQVRYQEGSEEEHRRMAREFWHNQDPRYRGYFSLTDNHGILPNKVAFWALEKKAYFNRKLLNRELTFRDAVCGWLGKSVESQEVPTDELTAFCEAHLGQELTGEETVTVRRLVVKAAEANGFTEPQPTRVGTLGPEALNNRLTKIESSFRFEKKRWVIIKAGELC